MRGSLPCSESAACAASAPARLGRPRPCCPFQGLPGAVAMPSSPRSPVQLGPAGFAAALLSVPANKKAESRVSLAVTQRSSCSCPGKVAVVPSGTTLPAVPGPQGRGQAQSRGPGRIGPPARGEQQSLARGKRAGHRGEGDMGVNGTPAGGGTGEPSMSGRCGAERTGQMKASGKGEDEDPAMGEGERGTPAMA